MSQEVPIATLFSAGNAVIGPPLVINVASDTHRADDIYHHMSQWGVRPEMFPAVTGVSLPALPQSLRETKFAVNLNLSHAAASRHCLINTTGQVWMVMEDDCRFLSDPRVVVANVLKAVQGVDWSVISLGRISHERQGPRPQPPDGYDKLALVQPKGWYPWGSHAYIVNRKHAARLVSMWSGCFYPADHVLLHEYAAGTGFLLRPSVAYQEEYASYQCEGNGVNSSKRTADLPPALIELICSTGPRTHRGPEWRDYEASG